MIGPILAPMEPSWLGRGIAGTNSVSMRTPVEWIPFVWAHLWRGPTWREPIGHEYAIERS